MAKTKQQNKIKLRYGAPIGFIASLMCVYALWQQPLLLFFVMIFISIFTLWIYDFRFIRTFLFVSLMGPIAEIIAMHAGAWKYVQPSFLSVPIWLFPLWGMAGICFLAVAVYYKDVKMQK